MSAVRRVGLIGSLALGLLYMPPAPSDEAIAVAVPSVAVGSIVTPSQTVARPLAFHSPGGDYVVSAAATVGTVVGDIAVADSNTATTPTFTLTSGTGFAVNSSTGAITTTATFPLNANSRKAITVSVADDGQTITSTFHVVVLQSADYDNHGITSQHWNNWFDYGLAGTLVYPSTSPAFTVNYSRPAVYETGGTQMMCTNASNSPNDKCGVRWSGYLVAPETGKYRFYVDGDGQQDIRIGTGAHMSTLSSGPLAIKQLNAGTEANVYIYTGEGTTGAVRLVKGQIYSLEVLANSHVTRDDFYSKLPHFNISWKTPTGPYPVDQKAATPVPATVIPSSAMYPELVLQNGATEFSASPMTVMQSYLTPPGRPSIEKVDNGAVTIAWESSTGGAGIDHYEVATDGINQVTIAASGAEITRTTLPVSTGTHTYSITAFDTSNASSDSVVVSTNASINYSALDTALITGDANVLTDPDLIINRFNSELVATGTSTTYAALKKTLDHIKARDWVAAPFTCTILHACTVPSNVSTFRDNEFAPGTTDLRNRLSTLAGSQTQMFATGSSVPTPIRLAVLLGDVLRRQVKYCKSSLRMGDGKKYYWAWYADNSVYDFRSIAPAAADMGTYSYTFGPNVPLFNDTLQFATRGGTYTTAAGVYIPAGQTVSIRRTDPGTSNISFAINMLRSGATRETADYQRPKYLTRGLGAVSSGNTLTFTSAYGGPLLISMSATGSTETVTVEVRNVGHHPVWNGYETTSAFNKAMDDADYNWVDFVTPGYQVHSRLWQMITTLKDPTFNTVEKLAKATFENFYQANFNLAGFAGSNLSLNNKVTSLCSEKGWDCTSPSIHGLVEMFHFNSDLSGCDAGYGCSGNPYDALWPFGPLGYGDSHELGHGMQKFLLTDASGSNASGEVSNNIFALHVYSLWSRMYPYKSQYTGTNATGLSLTTDGQWYLYNIVNNAQNTANATTTLANSIWGSGASANFTSVNNARLTFFQQFVEQAAHLPSGKIGDAGWDVFPLMYIMDRLVNKYANGSEANWLAQRDSLCMSNYSQAEAKAIGANDLFLIEGSCILGIDQRPFMDMWGLVTGTKARDQANALVLPAADKVWWMWPSDRINFHSQWPTSTSIPVDGQARTSFRIPEAVAWSLDDEMTTTVGQSTTIGAWLGAPGTVRFTADGVDITGCTNVGTTYIYGGNHYIQWDYKATCTWTPPTRGNVVIKAYLTTNTSDTYGAGRTNATTQDLSMTVRPSTPDVAVSSIALSSSALTMPVGQAQQLSVSYTPTTPSITGVTWSTSASNIAVVSSLGYVTAISPGTATITATSKDGSKTSTSAITVTNLSIGVSSVSLTSSTSTLQIGGSTTVSATVFPNYATNTTLTWTTSDPSIATVNSSGVVTGVGNGTATITATSADGAQQAINQFSIQTVTTTTSTTSTIAPTTTTAAPVTTSTLASSTTSLAPSTTSTVLIASTSTSSTTSTSPPAPASTTTIPAPSVASVDTKTVASWTAATIAAMAPETAATMTTAQVAALKPAAIAGLQGDQLDAMPPKAIAAITPTQAKSLKPAAIATMGDAITQLAPKTLASLSTSALKAAKNNDFVDDLSTKQIAALKGPQVKALGLDKLKTLTASQKKAVTAALKRK